MKSILRRMELRWAMYLQDLVRRSLLPVFQRELDRNVRRDWTAAMLASSNPLFRAGAKYYSQFDEDGILLEILRRLKLERGRFVEIGVGDGMENNTIILLVHGWTGLWLGNQTLAWSPTGTRLRFQQTMVSPDNVAGLVGDDPIDVLGLDVDGNDYWILKALLARSQPRVLVLEYNGKFPPPVRFVMPFDASHGWSGGDYFGASLSAWAALLEPLGYRPVCCSYMGLNVFFIRQEDEHAFEDVTRDLTQLYRPSQYLAPFAAGHPVSPRTLEAIERGLS
jgi:hypothetical protein